jgi:hypothetical protein
MGDFDRHNSSPKNNETKKLVVVLGLGVVLIAVVAMQFMKRGAPQAAAGAPVGNGAALPQPVLTEEISPQALANMTNDLKNDPTAPLLRGPAMADRVLNTPPRNPFRMSGAWLQSLLAAQTPVAAATKPASTPPVVTPFPAPMVTPFPAPALNVLRAEDYKLTGILNGTTAVINGRIVMVGDTVGKARIIDITDNTVRLQSADSPNGPTLALSLAALLGQ